MQTWLKRRRFMSLQVTICVYLLICTVEATAAIVRFTSLFASVEATAAI